MESMSDLIEFIKANNLESLTTSEIRDDYTISVEISKIEYITKDEDIYHGQKLSYEGRV